MTITFMQTGKFGSYVCAHAGTTVSIAPLNINNAKSTTPICASDGFVAISRSKRNAQQQPFASASAQEDTCNEVDGFGFAAPRIARVNPSAVD
jgi:hypothetical protein